jgi:hypothetical protein
MDTVNHMNQRYHLWIGMGILKQKTQIEVISNQVVRGTNLCKSACKIINFRQVTHTINLQERKMAGK